MTCAAAGGVWATGPEFELRGGWQPGPDIYHPSRVIVRFSDAMTTNAAVDSIERLGYSVKCVAHFKSTEAFPNGVRFGIVELPEEVSPDMAVSRLGNAPGILYAERDYIRYKDQVYMDTPIIPNDPEFAKMWGLHNENCQYKDPRMQGSPVDDADIDAPEAWAIHTGTGEVIVAVIDTGCYIFHPDLAANIWVNEAEMNGTPGVDDDGNGYIDDFWGWDWFNDDNSVWDPDERDEYEYLNDEHGTHTSGTIGALSNNGKGVAGINWDVKIMPLKFIGPDGGWTSDAILAFQYAADKGAQVASCSWGGGGYNQSLKDAIEASSMIVACAAGNTGDNTDIYPHYPSSYDSENIISVGAMMQNEMPCQYPGWWSTCWGPTSVDLFAPGGFILSTIPPDPPPTEPGEAYDYFYGTSMATPHVSGAAALLRSLYPDMPLYRTPGMGEDAATIKDMILDSVDVFPQYEGKVLTGGRLNIANAILGGGAPIITSFEATPEWGPPPLEVSFSAMATTPEGEIVDMWWDFGDDSEHVHEWETTHTYEEEGLYDASFHVVNTAGFEASATVQIHVFFPPAIGVEPTEIHTRLEWGETCEETIAISNDGLGDLDYAARIELVGIVDASGTVAPVRGLGSGGPDEYGYFWTDSDEPGVVTPEWFEISEIGTQVTLGGEDSVVVDLPFEFPFYGDVKNSIRISSNGYLTFGETGSTYSNKNIPNTLEPNDLIAIFWDDLEPQKGNGKVFHYSDDQKFVVQYQDVQRYSSGGPYTFQATLTSGGTITYLYKTMLGTRLDEATVGIENATGTVGLQVAYDEDYVHDDLGVLFAPGWVTLDKASGIVAPGESDTLTATFAAHNLPQGTWKATIKISSNDPENPQVDVDTYMFAKSIIPPVIRSISADPWAGSAPLTVQFSAVAEDIDGEIVEIEWDFGDGSDPVTGTLAPLHTYGADGEYAATLTVTDDDGLIDEDSITIIVADLPQASVDPQAFRQTMRAHRQRTETLTVTNTGEAALTFTAEAYTSGVPTVDEALDPLGEGGPDEFGYLWRDSDEPGGPVFDWVEISGIGTKLATLKDDETTTIDLPWEFPFYGQTWGEINVNANGWLNFGAFPSYGTYSNKAIPNTGLPNDLLAVFWDDLQISKGPAGAGAYYYHDEANDRFIVQFNKAPRYSWSGDGGEYTFEAILYPDGTIVYQYLEMQYAPANVDKGTIGIENSDGTDGLGVLHNTMGYMHDELAIRFKPYQWLEVAPEQATLEPGESIDLDVTFDLGMVGSGMLDGAVVLDTNDIRKPRTIVPVHIEVIPNNPPSITACSVNPDIGPITTQFQFVAAARDADGHIADKWWDFGDDSVPVHEFVATHKYLREGKFVATFTAVDNDGYPATQSVTVTVREPASASWNPKQFSFTLGGGQTAEGIMTLSNIGTGTLIFGSEELPNRVQFPKRLVTPDGIKDLNAMTAEGIYEPTAAVESYPWKPEGVGSVITSWPAPSQISLPWGVGVILDTGNLVISDPDVTPTVDHVVTAEGQHTGTSWTANFGGSWAGDMAFDGENIWQVNVGGDNGIYKLDPETGQVLGSISSLPWAGISQRGLAYNANDDTFYIGGWNEDIIYKIKGESWDNPGAVIEQWTFGVGIAGLAYHPGANVLAVTNNGSPDKIYFVDPDSHAVLLEFAHPGSGGDYTGAGCEFAPCGNLWAASMNDEQMYLIETGFGPISSGWLSWEPDAGSVLAGGSVNITVKVDASELKPGSYEDYVTIFTNDIENPMIIVPVTATVAAPPVITKASAEPVFGEPPLEVTFHAAFTAPEIPVVSYGWDFGDGTTSSELDVTHVYTAAGLYTATFSVTDQMGASDEASFEIEVKWLPRATCEPETIEVTLPPRGSATETVTLGNVEGNAELEFEVKVKGGSAPVVAMPERIGIVLDENARTAEGLYASIAPELVERIAASIEPGAVGDVITSWQVPSQIDLPWGVGFDGNVWITDPLVKKDHLVTPEGVHTGTVFSTPWAGSWPGDMAYDSNRNLMWQVNVGGDNGIYGLDPETGAVVMKITSGPWTGTSQRGLAYDADTDTFFIGGWNEDIIYHIYGPSHGSPGSVVAAYSFPVGISGLAWHPDGILWVTNNGAPDMIYGLDLDTLEVVYQFLHPYGGDYAGAGLALDSNGNLWASSQDNRYMYLINTEMPLAVGISVDPERGTVALGETAELEVTIDAEHLGKPGDEIRKYLEIATNDPENTFLYVDLIVHIEAGPTIVEATATPTIGEPPLRVAFDATVEAGATDIVDMWWDFGDGSDPVHEARAEHIYTDLGVYEAVFHVIDENEVEVTAELTVTVKWLPVLGVEPEEFDEIVPVGEEEQTVLTVSNTGVAPMNFEIAVAPSFAGSPEWKEYVASGPVKGDYASEPKGYAGAGAGGPDQFGYIWIDSNNAGGPEFDWFEISDVGTRLTLTDESIVDVNLPFAFPFYGDLKTKVRICSNGYLTFGTASSKWTNTPIPDPSDPNDLIAVFWDDLDPGTAGDVYYYHDQEAGRFIVEYQGVAKWWQESVSYTFQAILYPNGTIVFQYLEMIGELTSATVGIENATGTDGLQVVYNAPYIEDGLAIGFAPVGSILRVNPTSGYLVPGGRQEIQLTFGSPDAPYGTYSLYLYVSANDPYRPFATIPVTLKLNAPPAVAITAPEGGDELHGMTEITWTATDPDDDADDLLIDLAWTRDGETWHELGTGLANTGSFEWNTIEVGEAGNTFRVRARATDPAGAFHEFVTEEFTIINNAPTADFDFTPSPATRRDKVKFVDKSTDDGRIVAWHWEFGDETTSDAQDPEHQYAQKGEFEITLTVTDNGGLTGTATKTIEVRNAAPIAAFSFTSPARTGEAVKFTNESTDDGEIVTCLWQFGDGSTSDQWSPEHVYSSTGTFAVKLTVIDDDNVASSITHEIEIVNAPPQAAFSFTPASPTVETIVKFTDESIDDGEIVAWHWEFGDGAESSEQSPEHKYAEKGVFTVKLTVTDDGDLAGTAEETIEIINLPPEVEIITPTAGQVLTGEAMIEWEAVDPDDDADKLKITLEYKPASGGNWQAIASEVPNTGKYVWDTSKLERGGKYEIRITAVDPEGASGEAISEEFTVIALTRTVVAAPNPTSDVVTFYYDIAANGTLYVYDIAGRLVHSAELSATAHAHEWNLHSSGKPVANGVYLYVVIAGEERSEVGRLVVSR